MLMLPREANVYKRNRRWQYDRKVNVPDSFRPVAHAPRLAMHASRAAGQQKGPQLRGMRPDLRATLSLYSALMRAESRDNLRATVFRCSTPLSAPLSSSGSPPPKPAPPPPLSPPVIAPS